MNNLTQIPTPRTDMVATEGWKVQYSDVVTAQFARQLERELAVDRGIIVNLDNDLTTALLARDRLARALRLIAEQQTSWSVARTVALEAMKEVV